MVAGPLASNDFGLCSMLSCTKTCYNKAPRALIPLAWFGTNILSCCYASIFPDNAFYPIITMSVYIGWIVFSVYFLWKLEPLLKNDIFEENSRIENKPAASISKSTRRHNDRQDYVEWKEQEATRQKTILKSLRFRTNKHKAHRTKSNQEHHKEKKRERRNTGIEFINKSTFTETISLFLILWFHQDDPAPLSKIFHSTVHNKSGWDSVLTKRVPHHRMIHFCNYGSEWDRTCEVCPDILSLLGPEDKTVLQFGKPHGRPHEELPSLQYVFPATVDTTKLAETRDCIKWQYAGVNKSTKGDRNIIIDSGASVSISFSKDDFIELDTDPDHYKMWKVSGLASSPQVKGLGKVKWDTFTDNGGRRSIVTDALYIPDANYRLLSVMRYISSVEDGTEFNVQSKSVTFKFPKQQGGGRKTFPIHEYVPRCSIAAVTTMTKTKKASVFSVTSNTNINLTSSQKALLKLHFQLGHWNLPWLQSLIRRDVLRCPGGTNPTSKEAICQCAACNFAKQTKRPDGAKTHNIRPEKDGSLKKEQLRPGSKVFTDQFISSVPGRLPHTFGKEKDSEKQTGGTVWVDAASGFVAVDTQVSLNAAETLRSKSKFERDAHRSGIKILSYRADNGVYRSKEFMEDCKMKNQPIDFSGVGAHHHNGVAERAIRTITTCARAMLIHAMIHNPTEVQLDLWPFTIKYAAYLWNKMPKEDGGMSPEEVFYSVVSDHQSLRDAKVFGCPAYVLEPKLQDGKKIPRWNPRSRLGQFLGRSEIHASSVGLIRNLRTGKITSQYNVVYDNHFTTVGLDVHHDDIPVPEGFHNLVEFSSELLIDSTDAKENPPKNARVPPPLPTDENSQNKKVRFQDQSEILNPRNENTNQRRIRLLAERDNPGHQSDKLPEGNNTQEAFPDIDPEIYDEDVPPSHDEDVFFDTETEHIEVDRPPDSDDSYTSRYPTRSRTSPKYFKDEHEQYYGSAYLTYLFSSNAEQRDQSSREHEAMLHCTDLCNGHSAMTAQHDLLGLMEIDDFDEELLNDIHPLAFSARANAEDTPRYDEAMHSPDAEGFKAAMDIEMEQLMDKDVWNVVPRGKAISEGANIIDTVWAFKRKRYPDGTVKKLKARLCVRGFQQIEGVDYDDTYSPVVAWSTVRLLLILSILQNLKTKQIDFTLAFVHAPVNNGTYVEMPKQYEMDGMVLELNKNLYGLCDAPANFFYHLKGELEKRGFEPCKESEPCLFINKDTGCLMLVYVDDCIFFHKDENVIDDAIASLKSPTQKGLSSFDLGVEEDYAGFLGIEIKRFPDGTIELVQTGLIDRFLEAVELSHDNTNPRLEPAEKEPLGKDENGSPRREKWSYPSVIGMLLYLSSNSRPDISFAVSQCARFNHCPRLCHEIAVKRIARYLKGTRTQGLILKPESNLSLAMYADADFAGLWTAEDHDDPICVRSRTGSVITLGGVPITWTSKLQTEIATSTMHAEYIALSMSLRELLPISRLLNEICERTKIERDDDTKICRVFEDNEAAMKLAKSQLPKITPQSKHFAVKYHWFREKLDEYGFEILPVRTDKQKADLFTKGLLRTEFRTKRHMIMGW